MELESSRLHAFYFQGKMADINSNKLNKLGQLRHKNTYRNNNLAIVAKLKKMK